MILHIPVPLVDSVRLVSVGFCYIKYCSNGGSQSVVNDKYCAALFFSFLLAIFLPPQIGHQSRIRSTVLRWCALIYTLYFSRSL